MSEQRIEVPLNVSTEIKRMHLDLVAKAKQFEAARIAWGTYLRAVHQQLNVPIDGKWRLSEDATYFVDDQENP
jgi:hypothetical protein